MRSSAWSRQQVLVVAAANAVGAVLLLSAWAGSGGTAALGQQIGWLNMAVLGLLLGGAADLCLLLFGRKSVGHRRTLLLHEPVEVTSGAGLGAIGDGWWWVPGTQRAHRADCELCAGKPLEVVDASAIRSMSLRRCEVCGC